MKSQSVIFLALLGLIVVLSTAQTANLPKVTPQYVQALMTKQGPCILGPKNYTKCDTMGKILRKKMPQLLKGCTLKGCPNGDERMKKLADLIRKSNSTIWEMAINRYVLHKENTTTKLVPHKKNATTTTLVPHKKNATTTTLVPHKKNATTTPLVPQKKKATTTTVLRH